MKITNEIKAGIVVVAAIAATAVFYLKTTDVKASPYRLKAYFNYAEGLKEDAIVKLSGIEIGRVESIKFVYNPETKVELTLAVKPVAKIHQDTIAFIATSGMIGDAYIGLTPGSPDKPFLKDGDTVITEDPVEMRKLWKRAESIAENLDKTLSQVKALAASADSILIENKPRIAGIMANMEETSVNFKDFSQDLKQHPWKLLMK
jgi:phospholipid/cholesterol/gamma-HCH transport system substrate-binding protein